ncbi:MAG: hypothetical protein WCK67_07485 [bacterium]
MSVLSITSFNYKNNYKNNSNNSINYRKINTLSKDTVSFGNINKVANDTIKLTPIAKTALWFSKNCGETSNIVINALGKGLLAPLVVLFNPIVKQDKETKQYSALKLAIDASIMLVGQIGINSATSKTLDNLAHNKKLGENFNKELSKDALKKLQILKDRSSFALTFAALPFMCILINKVTPGIIKAIKPEVATSNKK